MTAFTDSPEVLQTWTIAQEDALEEWAVDFEQHLRIPSVVLLDGPMGSGKTTLVRYLLKALNGEEASSPTFSLVNEYRYDGGVVYHFDLYRLESPEELEEIGFEEYLDAPALCLVEWPRLGKNFYDPQRTTTLRIEILSPSERKIQWIKGVAL